MFSRLARLSDSAANAAVKNSLRWLVDYYFRVETAGLENIPDSGPAILVANHSGAWGLDGFILHASLSRDFHRCFYIQASSLVLKFPILGPCAHSVNVRADPTLGYSELVAGQLVAMFPEGFAGLRKPFRQRYQLRPFGPGFAATAICTGAPIVPVSIIGAEEALPKVAELSSLARLLNLPYFPVTTAFPLPSKWLISAGKPIAAPPKGETALERSSAAQRLSGEVQLALQEMLELERLKRNTPFW
ncbi:1-acyl-sn-glycerol-3-phosphate acyltransferase [Streptomyces sp. NPDC001667]